MSPALAVLAVLKMLDAVLPELLAQAWDEGHDEGWLDHIARVEVGSELTDTPNPYRRTTHE